MEGRRAASAGLAGALAALGAFEIWNHRTGVWPLLAGAAAPLAGPRGARTLSGPLWLGLAGFQLPRHGSRAQVAALGWAACVFAQRALAQHDG